VQSLQKDKRAVSPAISTVILTAAVVVMILVAMSFANSFLDARMAENEFSTNKQFMLTTGLQMDDIAWTVGRTQTVRYSSKYGNIKFQSLAVNYTFEVDTGSGWTFLFSNATGMILFNIPVSTYSISNNYFERIMPSSNGSFLQQGPSAPVSQVFCVEKLPMVEGNYTRIVAVPSIRMLTSTIEGPEGTPTNYTKFYLPTLEPGTHLYRSQSITMTGNDITKIVKSGVNQVRITVTFPNTGSGFDSNFFNFDHISETKTLSPGSVVEFYVGRVIVTLGQV
jgi:hypothetical protein